MKQEDYRACMSKGLKGKKGLSKEERQTLFCIESRLCSGKAQTKEQAAQLCSTTAPKQPQQSPSPQINPCASVVDMATWVQQPNGDGPCRPCLLAPLTQWYMDVLRTGGRDDLAAALEGAVDGGEVVLATKLDEVKGEVSPELRARLKEFDCHAQLYKEGEDGN
jgi:hypothetical protein